MGSNRWLSKLRPWKHLLLLVTLLLLAVLHPITSGRFVGQGTFDFLLTVVLLAAIFAVGQKKRPLLAALWLGIPALAATWVIYLASGATATAQDMIIVGQHVVQAIFFAYVVALILCDVLQGDRVTADKLFGAICTYILLGVIWALIYSMIYHLQPQAFVGTLLDQLRDGQPISQHLEFSHLLYYSFVTLTTLGYGDLTPVSPVARVFTWLEAVTGQLYLAVLIGRLVGLHIADARRRS